jgi:cellulase/cellobiase CelA1
MNPRSFLISILSCSVVACSGGFTSDDVSGSGAPNAGELGSAEQQLGSDCTASAFINVDFGTGFQATVSVRNDGEPSVSWEASWSFDEGQTVRQIFNATLAGPPTGEVVAASLDFNGRLNTGQSTTFGFVAGKDPATPAELASLSCTMFR